MKLLEGVGWWVFFGLGPILWGSGVWLFLHSSLAPAKKVGWSLLLLAIGAAIGGLLSLPQIRDRFMILLAALPILAMVDVRIARSRRGFSFWLRACAFEICTVFGVAALTRLALDRWMGHS